MANQDYTQQTYTFMFLILLVDHEVHCSKLNM